MNSNKKIDLHKYVVILLALFFISSCTSPKKILYFQDFPDTVHTPLTVTPTIPFVDPKIESNDNLSISVRTIIPGSATPIAAANEGTFNPLNGFLVDKDGYIELPLVGFVKVAGLTTTEARELIKQKAKEFFKDPVVNVRISNFEIVVLGAIGHVGPINAINEKISILDVIAQCGDLPYDSKHNNILLIRHIGDENKIIRYDMSTSKIFQSPYFYLKQHDIVYVQPTNFRIQKGGNNFLRTITIMSSVLSFGTLLFVFRSRVL